MFRLPLYLTTALLIILGCRPRLTRQPGTVPTGPAVHAPAPGAATSARFLNENDRRAALARGPVPGYAGEMVEGCNFVVLLTDTARQGAAARKYVGNRVPPCMPRGRVVLRQVKYDFAQLYDWYVGPFRVVWREKGVTSSSIRIQHNRIEVGIAPGVETRVQRLLDSLPIPKDAVGIVPGIYGCTGTGGPSVIVKVRDQLVRPAAVGTTIVIQDGTFRDSVDGAGALSQLVVARANVVLAPTKCVSTRPATSPSSFMTSRHLAAAPVVMRSRSHKDRESGSSISHLFTQQVTVGLVPHRQE